MSVERAVKQYGHPVLFIKKTYSREKTCHNSESSHFGEPQLSSAKRNKHWPIDMCNCVMGLLFDLAKRKGDGHVA